MTQDTTKATTAVAMPDMSMLENSGWSQATESVMAQIHTLKVYNPAPWKEPDPEKAGKFQIKEASTGEVKFIEWPISYNILSILEVFSGQCYPVDNSWFTANEAVYFTTNEYSRFTSKEQPIGLRWGRNILWFFDKQGFQAMIKSKILNGDMNFFYKQGKTVEGRPYDSSELSKSFVVYGRFTSGEHKDEYFRTFMKPQYFGITWDNDAQERCDAADGTLLAAIDKALPEFNKVRESNSMKAVRSIAESQVIVKHSITKNEKGNFLSHIDYEALQMMLGSNIDDVEYIHGLQEQHFENSFGNPTPMKIISVEWGKATLQEAYQDYSSTNQKAIASGSEEEVQDAETEEITVAWAEAIFNQNKWANAAVQNWAPY